MKVNEWVVVASRHQIKIFKRSDTKKPLQWIYTLRNPDIQSNNEVSPSMEKVIQRWARKISDILKLGSEKHSFGKLHIFADPHLLGHLKNQIPKSMKSVLIEWIGKDLEKATAQQLTDRVLEH